MTQPAEAFLFLPTPRNGQHRCPGTARPLLIGQTEQQYGVITRTARLLLLAAARGSTPGLPGLSPTSVSPALPGYGHDSGQSRCHPSQRPQRGEKKAEGSITAGWGRGKAGPVLCGRYHLMMSWTSGRKENSSCAGAGGAGGGFCSAGGSGGGGSSAARAADTPDAMVAPGPRPRR